MKTSCYLMITFILYTIRILAVTENSLSYTFSDMEQLNLQQAKNKQEKQRSFHLFSPKVLNSRPYQMLHTAVPLFIAGSIIYNHEHEFRNMRNTYIPQFKYSYDDFLQYAPMVLMYGLKLGGVESRNSWGRMMTSNVFSATIMATFVNGLKYTIKKERPDHSTHNSFPSGHSATAFMAATMLHKEYGLTQSPIYSIAGYTVATLTGISRQLNNRHWMSDVLVGAGLGIFSTELGYWLGDLIFRQKGIKKDYIPQMEDDIDRIPSHFGMTLGYILSNSRFGNKQDLIFNSSFSVISSLEGAWFFDKHWGVGASINAIQSTALLNNARLLEMHPSLSKNIVFENANISIGEIGIGGLYAYPILSGLRLMTNVSMEIGVLKSTNLHMYKYEEKNQPDKMKYFNQSKSLLPGFKTRLHFIYMFNHTLGMGIFGEYKYKYANIKYQIKENLEDWNNTQFYVQKYNKNLNFWVIGGSISAYLNR